MVGDILSSALGSIWYGMIKFCRYLDDFGYSITIIAFGLHILNIREKKITYNSYINEKKGPIR